MRDGWTTMTLKIRKPVGSGNEERERMRRQRWAETAEEKGCEMRLP